jgi:ABC-type Fe3+ transport system permease subunit
MSDFDRRFPGIAKRMARNQRKNRMNQFQEAVGAIVIAIGLVVAALAVIVLAAFLSGFVLMLGFNHGVAAYLHLPEISYWPAFWVSIFFGVIGSHFKSTLTQK